MRSFERKSRRFGLGAIVIVVIAGGGTAFATTAMREKHLDGAPAQIAPSRGAITPFPADRAAGLRQLAAGLPDIANPQLGKEDLVDANADIHGTLLTFDIRVQAIESSAAVAIGLWQGDVFTGAVAERLSASGEALADVQETLVTPSGERRPIGGGIGKVVHNQLFDAAPADLPARASVAGQHYGLELAGVNVLHGLRDAILIRARSANPGRTAAEILQDPHVFDNFVGGNANAYEGVLLEVLDSKGDGALVKAFTPINGSGITWARPDLGVQLRGVPHGSPTG